MAIREIGSFGRDSSSAQARADNREPELIRKAKNGDVRAFNELVRMYQPLAYRVAYRVLGDVDAASDATQDAFTLAYRNIQTLRGDSLRGWLLRIVTNTCYQQLRKKRRQHEISLDGFGDNPDQPSMDLADPFTESPQDHAERRELDRLIEQGLGRLPFDQRMTLVLADIEEYSYEQVAEITQANIGTVKSRLARARGGLRDFMRGQEDILPARYRRR
ncbi:MAG: RNA polymerase sigma factor [Rudaea sp.]